MSAKLLTESQVAEILNCTPMQVRRLPIDHRFNSPNRKRGKRY